MISPQPTNQIGPLNHTTGTKARLDIARTYYHAVPSTLFVASGFESWYGLMLVLLDASPSA